MALSRVNKIDKLFLIGKYSPDVFKVNKNAIIEYSMLRENLFDRIYIDMLIYVVCNSLPVLLLNTRSLVRHAVDINRTKQLMENYILCLAETQITNNTDGTEIFEELSTFKVYFNSCGARHQNLAFCLGQNFVLLEHKASISWNIYYLK